MPESSGRPPLPVPAGALPPASGNLEPGEGGRIEGGRIFHSKGPALRHFEYFYPSGACPGRYFGPVSGKL